VLLGHVQTTRQWQGLNCCGLRQLWSFDVNHTTLPSVKHLSACMFICRTADGGSCSLLPHICDVTNTALPWPPLLPVCALLADHQPVTSLLPAKSGHTYVMLLTLHCLCRISCLCARCLQTGRRWQASYRQNAPTQQSSSSSSRE
jgi:hypothetical protein